MKLKFKKQAYQTRAVDAVVDCFKGQLNSFGMKEAVSYRMDPGASQSLSQKNKDKQIELFVESALKNSELTINDAQILPQSEILGCCINNRISMTGLLRLQ